eukprot:m.218112 g.218112  ORF g.218112 m.218112 type:complete len:419 (-) comp29446_c0_seq1:45-1301(-)
MMAEEQPEQEGRPTVTVVAGGQGEGFRDGPAATALFSEPTGVCAAPDGSYFVADTGNHVVRWITPPPERMVITIAGTPGEPGHVDGTGTAGAKLSSPYGITRDQHGVLHVTDGDYIYGSRLRTIWPYPDLPGSQWVVSTPLEPQDTVMRRGILMSGRGVAVTSAGTPIVVEGTKKSMGLGVQVVRCPGTKVKTMGYAGEPFCTLSGVVVDPGPSGDVFFTELRRNRIHRISEDSIDVAAVVAGTGTGPWRNADGPGIDATFDNPMGIAVDAAGVLVVTEASRPSIRLIAPTDDRKVTTVPLSFSHDYGRMFNPRLCSVDYSGGLVVADKGNAAIWRIDNIGLVPLPQPFMWTPREHRKLARDWKRLGTFVATVLLCAQRIDRVYSETTDVKTAVPPLPFDIWAVILALLSPGEMHSKM